VHFSNKLFKTGQP